MLDYLENLSESPRYVWCAGYSFGAWITLQLLMRRPEIDGFLAISPPANHYDLSFLAPCPASGLIVAGDKDTIASPEDVERALTKVRVQKGQKVDRAKVSGANHFYQDKREELIAVCEEYLLRRLAEAEQELRAEADEDSGADVVVEDEDFED